MKIQLTKITFAIVVAISVFACEQESIKGSGTILSETRDLASFSAIEAGDAFEILVSKGNQQNVVVVADDNLVDIVSTEVNNGVLSIGFTKSNVNLRGETLQVLVDMTNLEAIRLEDASTAEVKNFSDLSSVDISLKDGSELSLQGSAKDLDITVKDASKLRGFSFTTENCKVVLEDASLLEISCEQTLEGTAKDASKLRYKGNPSVDVTTSDAAKVIDAN